jgi:hypothetical protein
MNLTDFKLGLKFCCGGKLWLCTDVGTRVVVGVCLNPCSSNGWFCALPNARLEQLWERDDRGTEPLAIDPSWLDGPPYAVAEHVFDEDDLSACEVAR